MAIALEALRRRGKIETAYVLDFDLHFGDGNVNILGDKGYVTVYNVESNHREAYLEEVMGSLEKARVDIIGVSAGFDNHEEDWGGVLTTGDYREMGRSVRQAARRCDGGCFGILEGGYNHQVLGQNVLAFLKGLCH
jgi:acetoin utilization deacetylase AcuC-like enzyme